MNLPMRRYTEITWTIHGNEFLDLAITGPRLTQKLWRQLRDVFKPDSTLPTTAKFPDPRHIHIKFALKLDRIQIIRWLTHKSKQVFGLGIQVRWDRDLWQAVKEEEKLAEKIPWWELLHILRLNGWEVAAHNDYRLNGASHTFWLFTRNGMAIKGEGPSDQEAIEAICKPLGIHTGRRYGAVSELLRLD